MSNYLYNINEDLRFEALAQLREIQSNLVAVSFLPVIAIMKPENPLKKDVIKFQDELDKLTLSIQDFIAVAKNDIDYQPSDEEKELEDDSEKELEDDSEKELEDDSEKEQVKKLKKKPKKEVEDSSVTKE